MDRHFITHPITHPMRLFLLVLGIVFGVEAAVMLMLPLMVSHERQPRLEALLDACLLTVLISPILWWIVVRPVSQLLAARTHLLARVLSAQEDERRRIARELHDVVGQGLTSLMVGLKNVEHSTGLDAAQQLARELRVIGSETHEEIRLLCRGLRPAALDDLGLVAGLERMMQDLEASHGTNVALDSSRMTSDRLPSEVETALYRIIQEALTNAIKHGQAKHIRVALRDVGKSVMLTIADDGTGFDPKTIWRNAPGSGPFGLTSIRERASLLHGTARIVSAPGKGTSIFVQLPVNEELAAGLSPSS